MTADEMAEQLPPSVADLVRALADIRTLSSGPPSKRNNAHINAIACDALNRLEEALQEME